MPGAYAIDVVASLLRQQRLRCSGTQGHRRGVAVDHVRDRCAGAAQLAFTNICDNTAGSATPCFNDLNIAGNPVTDNTSTSPHYGTTYLAIDHDRGTCTARGVFCAWRVRLAV